jgi:hypothetical protein
VSDEEFTPSVLSQEEMQRRFLQYLKTLAHYWADLDPAFARYNPETDGKSFARYQLEGFVHSLLVLLDGGASGLPAFRLIPDPHPSDAEFRRERGMDWWPESSTIAVSSIEGKDALHDLWNAFRRGERFLAKPTRVVPVSGSPPIEVFMREDIPYVVAPIEDHDAVEDALPEGWTVGHSWWNTPPTARQTDGRWKLLLWRVEDMKNSGAFGDKKNELRVIQGGKSDG